MWSQPKTYHQCIDGSIKSVKAEHPFTVPSKCYVWFLYNGVTATV